mmetsp:Transcript_5338/g.10026  ORF Transcript_5338/g.10026 Transcript_5338/m.10026 type:complete len:766 (-) Transcript_5338:102-2399(-)
MVKSWRPVAALCCIVAVSRIVDPTAAASGGVTESSGGKSTSATHHHVHHGTGPSSSSISSSNSHNEPHVKAGSGADDGPGEPDDSNQSTTTKSKKKRYVKKSTIAKRKAIHAVFEGLKGAIATHVEDEISSKMKKLEQYMQYCDYFDIGDELDHDEGDAVTDQLAAVLGLEGIQNKEEDNSTGLVLVSGKKRSKTRSSKSGSSADKQEILRLKRLVKSLKDHQKEEVAKLVAVKQGVESLVASLSGTRKNLLDAKKASSNMGAELERIHKQTAAAAQLEQEINEIHEHARVSYETGELVLVDDSGEISELSLDVIAAKMQLANGDGGHHLHADDLLSHDKGEVLSKLADPAILHADLRMLLDVVVLLCSAAIGGMLSSVAFMPPLVGYIAGGVIAGPNCLSLLSQLVEVETLASFGSVFFLFNHGLAYSFKEQKAFYNVAIGGCFLSTAICTVAIQLYALASGVVQSPLEGGLIGLSTSLSSLSLVLDNLHEQKLQHSVHGKLLVGMLTVQGLGTGVLFSIPPAISGGVVSFGGVGFALLSSLMGVLLVAVFAYACSVYVMPSMLEFLLKQRVHHDELFLLGIVSLAMFMAILTEFLGLSLDLGAFFAGLMLSSNKFAKETADAIQPLAHVFAALLFASIGMIISPAFFWANLGSIMIVVLQIVVIKVIVITTVVRLFKYTWRVSLLSGLALAHVGEFSLLFSSKLQAHLLLSRRAYLIFLAATVTTIVITPLCMRLTPLIVPKLLRVLRISDNDDRPQRDRLHS